MSKPPPFPTDGRRPPILALRTLHAIKLAGDASGDLGHRLVGPDHLLIGVIEEGRGMAARVLAAAGVTSDAVRARARDLSADQVHSPASNRMSDPARRAVSESGAEVERFGNATAEPHHLLLALLDEPTCAAILDDLGVDREALRRDVQAAAATVLPGRLPDLSGLEAEERRLHREANAAWERGDRDTHRELFERRQALDRRRRDLLRQWASDADLVDVTEVLVEIRHLRAEVARLRG